MVKRQISNSTFNQASINEVVEEQEDEEEAKVAVPKALTAKEIARERIIQEMQKQAE